MKLSRWLSVPLLVLSLVPQIASADDSLVQRMQKHIEADLLTPLAARDSQTSKFSRMRPPPAERRVRMTQPTTSQDQAGRAFLPFAIDEKYAGSEWTENNTYTGCVYTEKGDMFVKIGDAYRPASFLLGQNADPVAGVCVTPAKA